MSDSTDIPVPSKWDFMEIDLRAFIDLMDAEKAARDEAERLVKLQEQQLRDEKRARRAQKVQPQVGGVSVPAVQAQRYASAYMRTPEVREAQPGIKISDVWKILAAEWKAMTKDAKSVYEKDFAKRNALFEFDNPDYDLPRTNLVVNRKRNVPDSFPSDAYATSNTASSEASEVDGRPEHTALKPKDTKYNWRGLQLRRKSTQRQERRREQKKAKLNVAEQSSSVRSYRPIAAKANTALHLAPVPLGRASRKDSSRASFWEIPSDRAPPANVTYGKKPFFAARRAKYPSKPSTRSGCDYCQGQGLTGSRLQHLYHQCPARTVNQQAACTSINSEDDMPTAPITRDDKQVMTARPFSLDTFTKSRKADQVQSKAISSDAQMQTTMSSISSSEEAYFSETPSLIADEGSPGASIASVRATPRYKQHQGKFVPPDDSITWMQALTGGDMGLCYTAPALGSDQTQPKSPDLPTFDDFLNSDDIVVEQPDGLSGGDRALLNAMLASQASYR